LPKKKEVGTTLKTELEEDIGSSNVDIYAINTILRLNNYSELTFIKQFKEFIMTKAKNSLQTEELNNLNNILENQQCGLLVNERFMNLPLALIPPLFNLLKDDMNGFKEDNPDDKTYDMDYVIVFSKYKVRL